jgi:hypothetical protein
VGGKALQPFGTTVKETANLNIDARLRNSALVPRRAVGADTLRPLNLWLWRAVAAKLWS